MGSKGRKAIALLSGGLDSLLAIAVTKAQGIEVEALHFYTGFSVRERRRRLRQEGDAYEGAIQSVGARLGVTVRVLDISQELLDVVLHPRYGYGANVNPCLDCRLLMLRKARQHMVQGDADFVITGEVLGQRPMSQHRNALRLLERESGLEGLLLRPLSAKLLPPTIPEKEEWVNREKLCAFQGRSRKPQVWLAEELGVKEYPQPAGGCLLTDENYARRFRDLIAHTDPEALTPDDMMLLAIGRHFRISEHTKCIVGREEAENDYLDQARGERGRMTDRDHVGPVTLVEGMPSEEDKRIVARITARYSDGRAEPEVAVVHEAQGKREVLEVEPMPLQEAHKFMI
ncbi:MAG: thiamine biosynthesis protein [Chloroflexota bacterium]|nr:thiamine biosynthesis protein [Chloroflexota bacterium]